MIELGSPLNSIAIGWTMEQFATWGPFAIPLILLGISVLIQKVVDSKPFSREHFYLGIDLTVYFLASTLINFLDIAHSQPQNGISIDWNVILLLAAIVVLFIQIGVHQSWADKSKECKTQIVMMCIWSNFLGILLLYGFVKLKVRGLI